MKIKRKEITILLFFIVALAILLNRFRISAVQDIKQIEIFVVISTFFIYNCIKVNKDVISLSDLLFYILFVFYGENDLYLFAIEYIIVMMIINKIRLNTYRVLMNILNLSLYIIMIFCSSIVTKKIVSISNMGNFSENDKILLSIVIFAFTFTIVNGIIINLYDFIIETKKYKFNIKQEVFWNILPSVISIALSYLFIKINNNISNILAYILLFIVCLVIYSYNILNKVLEKNKQMTILNKIARILLGKGELLDKLNTITLEFKEIIDYNYMGIYTFDNVYEKLIPFSYNNSSKNECKSLEVNDELIRILNMNSFYSFKENSKMYKKKVLGEDFDEKRNTIILPLRENEQILGLILIIYEEKIIEKFYKDIMEVLAVFVSLTIMNEEKYNKLEDLANRDAMTSLLNYRKYKYLINKLIVENQKFSVAIFDIDDFKKINDKYGHLAGDKVLKRISSILMEHVKGMGVPCRYGGEEFVIVFNNINEDDAANICEKVRIAIEEYDFNYNHNHFKITVSCGVGEYNENDYENIFKIVDSALYISKKSGKNKVTIAQRSESKQ